MEQEEVLKEEVEVVVEEPIVQEEKPAQDEALKAQEDKFVEELRKKYPVVIYEDVLSTVNNH